jgi:uncharacterized cupredoxin-like copper-binding protein
MFRRLVAGVAGALMVTSLVAVVPASAVPAPVQQAAPVQAAAAQVLNWTADGDITDYQSAPTTAVAGATTIVFENSEATGNVTGMSHTLTFDTDTPGYNHDVNVDILANPFDSNNGKHQVDVVLTPGKYRFFCALPGHSGMVGELIVEAGGPDTIPPTVDATVSGNKDPQGNYIGSATVNVTAADTGGSGLDFVEYQIDDLTYQRYTAPFQVTEVGDHSVQYRATDKAGNVSQTGSKQFSVVEPQGDDIPPTVNATVAGNNTAKATVTVTASDADSGVKSVEYKLDSGAWTAYTAPVDVTTPGSHMLHYRATDNANNVSPEGMVDFTVVAGDTTPPTVNATVAGNNTAKATVTVTATDSGTGVKSTEYKLDSGPWTAYTAPVDVTAAGSHMLHYRATDNANNVSPEGMVSFTVTAPPDTTPPTVNATVAGNNTAKATVTVTATDSGSGVKSTEYKLDNGAWTAYTAPVDVTTAGAHTLAYRATDNANNVSAEGSVNFTVTAAPDTTPPTVNAAVAGNNTAKATVTITATDAGSGVKSTEYKLDSGQWTAYTAPVDVTAAGSHMLHYRATDNANNVSPEGMVSFTVTAPPDTTAPTVNASVAGNNTAKATVTVTATDAGSGVKSIEYKLDNGAWTAYTAPVDVTAAGTHTLAYRATDNANNVSAEGSTNLTVVAPPVDTTAPNTSAAVTGAKDPQGNYLGSATVTITATDSQSGVKTVEYALDNSAWTAYTTAVRVNALGAHTLKYRATDNAGNVAVEKSVSFTVVGQGSDVCPEGDNRATVIIERDDTKVANKDTGNGCTVSDLIDQYGDHPSHGAFVRHVELVTDDLVTRGVLTIREQSTLVRAAARSDIGN